VCSSDLVTVRLPIKSKPTTSLLSASCLLTFSENSEGRFFCTTQLLKVDWLVLCKCFILLKTNIAKQGGTFHSEAFYDPFRRIALTIHSNRNVSLLHSLRGQKERQSKIYKYIYLA